MVAYPPDKDNPTPLQVIQGKRNVGKSTVTVPAVKEQILAALRQNPQGKLRLAKSCGGVAAIDAVLLEAIEDLIAQGGVTPRFRNGFGKPIDKEVRGTPRLKGVA